MIASSFGLPVPPAPPRHDVAPDTSDSVVDISDISTVAALFGLTCTPCPDSDSDGWTDCQEAVIGTDPAAPCSTGPAHDAWPADLNNDGISDITDISLLAGSFGQPVPPAPPRHDVAPDPPDGIVDISDISAVAAFFGQAC